MPNIGVSVTTSENPPAITNPYSTATAYLPGVADWGPSTPQLVTSLTQAASLYGTPSGTGNPYSGLSATNANLFNAIDEYLRDGGSQVWVARATGTGAASATIALAPSAALTLTAAYPGVGGNGIYVAVTNNTSNYVLTLQDVAGNVLAGPSPQLTTLAAGVSWVAGTGLATAVSSGSTLPSTAAATAMTGGSNGSAPTLAQVTAALNQLASVPGVGQVFAHGWTNTTLPGIWAALGQHGQNNNRVAIWDLDDNISASAAVTALGSLGNQPYASYCGAWIGNVNIPGSPLAPNTTRSVAPSPVIAALCARADFAGNPNLMAAGINFPLRYASGSASFVTGTSSTYSATDLNTLNAAGINTFQTKSNRFVNYGFVSIVPQSADAIYWQFNHARLRMAIVAQAQAVGEPFVFAQLDGQGSTIARFSGALQNMLMTFWKTGALYGLNATDAFDVNTGAMINTLASLAAGNLVGFADFEPSPGAQSVPITLNALPITQAIPQSANPTTP